MHFYLPYLVCSGCVDTSHCPNGYQCNAHICTADEGKALLKSIKVYSTSCTDCTTEGLVLTLNGRQDVVNKIRCKTNTLDHHNVNDYDGGDTVFDDKLTLGTYTPDGGCLSVSLLLIIKLSQAPSNFKSVGWSE